LRADVVEDRELGVAVQRAADLVGQLDVTPILRCRDARKATSSLT